MRKLFSALLLVAFAATIYSAGAGEKLTIAVSIRSMSSEYHMQYIAGAEAFLKTLPPDRPKSRFCPANPTTTSRSTTSRLFSPAAAKT